MAYFLANPVYTASALWTVVHMQAVVNLYSAHMDPDDWKQPNQFDPERFLDDSGNVVDRERILSFGLGG